MSLRSSLKEFFGGPIAGGIVLMASTLAALLVANSSLYPIYDATLSNYFAVTYDGSGIEKPLILWINDGLMAIFFLLVGLELKREILEGKLRNPRDVILPGMAAVGGMAVPAAIFVALNWGEPTLKGWAIPAATDIAFALGVLALVGSRAPKALSIFLLTLAILDDMGAIIIALFYSENLNVDYLLLALLPLFGMWIMNREGAHRVGPILILGVVMWVFVLRSGVHATLAGVITAFMIPLRDRYGKSPLHSLEHALSPYVFFVIVPVFAFANAGVVLSVINMEALTAPLTMGIALGLFLGKLAGVFGVTWLIVTLGLARLPYGVTWQHILGVAALAGIGFTMSLFIGSLSFDDAALMNEVRLGVLMGSVASGLLGYLVLRFAKPVEDVESAREQMTRDPIPPTAAAE